MRVLIGCEESGKVRRAFRDRGHDAYSNDLIPSRDNSPYHLQMDVVEAVQTTAWDIIILHLPCTAMAVSGNSTYAHSQTRIDAENWSATVWSLAKEKALIGAALENPVSTIWHKCGRANYIQPYEFGHPEQKKTGILVDRLPPLRGTKNVYEAMMLLPKKERERLHYLSPSKDRAMLRSETFQGIADAMAEQWGSL